VKIKSIEPIAVGLPMKKPVTMAAETVTRADNVLVRVEDSGGCVGWGEAASAPNMTGETVVSMMAAIAHMTPALLGRSIDDLPFIVPAMDAQMYGNSGAKAAIEIALHDLVGRRRRRPLYAMLGPKRRSRIPVLAVIGSTDAAADLREAKERWAAGYRAFKIKVGLGLPELDGERTRAICRMLKSSGDECLVCADVNQGWGGNVDFALRYVAAVRDCGLDFIEQPVRAQDLGGMARIAAATSIPIGADEGIHSLYDVERHHRSKAAAGVSLKAIKLGGVQAVLDACRVCDSLRMRVNISCKTGESSVASAAALHLATVAPELAWGLTVTSPGVAEDVVTEPLRVDSGHVEVSERPGLGIEVDERRVRQRQDEFRRVA
jgi:L-alanine-DL-glutamate epimerase-like enolase superfamily enzyme